MSLQVQPWRRRGWKAGEVARSRSEPQETAPIVLMAGQETICCCVEDRQGQLKRVTKWVREERRGPTTLDCPGKCQVSLPLSTRMRQNLGTSGTYLRIPNRRIVPPSKSRDVLLAHLVKSLCVHSKYTRRHTHTHMCLRPHSKLPGIARVWAAYVLLGQERWC